MAINFTLTLRGSNWRISNTDKYGKPIRFEVYYAGDTPPTSYDEDLTGFATMRECAQYLLKKGAKKSEVNQIFKYCKE